MYTCNDHGFIITITKRGHSEQLSPSWWPKAPHCLKKYPGNWRNPPTCLPWRELRQLGRREMIREFPERPLVESPGESEFVGRLIPQRLGCLHSDGHRALRLLHGSQDPKQPNLTGFPELVWRPSMGHLCSLGASVCPGIPCKHEALGNTKLLENNIIIISCLRLYSSVEKL